MASVQEAQNRRVEIQNVRVTDTFRVKHKKTKVETVVDAAAWAEMNQSKYDVLDPMPIADDDEGDDDTDTEAATTTEGDDAKEAKPLKKRK